MTGLAPGSAPIDIVYAVLMLLAAVVGSISSRLARVAFVVAGMLAAAWLALEVSPLLALLLGAGVGVGGVVEGGTEPPSPDFGRLLVRIALVALAIAVAGVTLVRLVDVRVEGFATAFPVLATCVLAGLRTVFGNPGAERSRPARLALVLAALGWMVLRHQPDVAAAVAVAVSLPLVALAARRPAPGMIAAATSRRGSP